ncbi:MAG TPA: sialidase family protein, partial [Bryobacteraceae bacterium]|nr:sialidase family protein [Bryobacteraceae bacterium]
MISRRGILAGWPCLFAASSPAEPLPLERSVIFAGRTARTTFFQPRACPIPGSPHPAIFLTAAPTTGDDVFWNLHWSESADLGRTWSEPKPLPGLARIHHPGGLTEELLVDAGPDYHPPTGSILVLGDNVYYAKDGRTQARLPGRRWQQPTYLVRGRDGRWSPLRQLEWDDARASAMINAGNSQRVILAGGDLLLPLSYAPEERYQDGPLGAQNSSQAFDRAVAVTRCSFDGKTLAIRSVGTEFRLPVKRGLIEPSLAAYRGRFYLTIRAEDGHGYASTSSDGLAWEKMRPWSWDNGEAIAM